MNKIVFAVERDLFFSLAVNDSLWYTFCMKINAVARKKIMSKYSFSEESFWRMYSTACNGMSYTTMPYWMKVLAWQLWSTSPEPFEAGAEQEEFRSMIKNLNEPWKSSGSVTH